MIVQKEKIQNKIIEGARVSFDEALYLYNEMDLLSIGYLANIARQKKHPDSEPVTFVIDRNINYTNVCSCECSFCSFYKSEADSEAYVLTIDKILEKVQELVNIGGTQVLLQGGLNSAISYDYYINLISELAKAFPDVSLHAFSPPEISFIAKENNLSVLEVLSQFHLAGLSSLPGGGAEILSDDIRLRVSPKKISSEEWLKVMETAHNIGLSTTATLMQGIDETERDIITHLSYIRDLQDKTNGFKAFIPWSYQSSNKTYKSEKILTGHDYLRLVAISRIYLDNIDNVQVSWPTQGIKVAQVALSFGANDFGGLMIEENVISSTGIQVKSSLKEILNAITASGRLAAQRSTNYEKIRIYN